MKSLSKYIFITLLWVVGGILSWLCAIYIFTNFISSLIIPVTTYFMGRFSSSAILSLSRFVLFNISDFIMVFLFSIILSILTGVKKIWVIGFIAGATGYTIYLNIIDIITDMKYYGGLPPWVVSPWWHFMISSFVIIPFLAWIGCRLGGKKRQK